jgi:Probable Zinc-ribbon domain
MISQTHPQYACQLKNPQDASVTYGSRKLVIWVCSEGHEYEMSPKYKISKKQGCPSCNQLWFTHPDLSKYLVNQNDTKLSHGSNLNVMWTCSKGHLYQMSPKHKIRHPDICPVCYNRRLLVGFNDLNSSHPKISELLVSYKDGETVSYGSKKKLLWKCLEHNHQYLMSPKSKITQNKACPVCSNQVIQKGINNLNFTHPEIASLLVISNNGDQISYGSNKKVLWKCLVHDHRYLMSPKSKIISGSGCPICSNQQVLPSYNDISTTHPHHANQLVNPELGKTVTYGSNKLLKWQCEEQDHTYKMSPKQKIVDGNSCPKCPSRGGYDPTSPYCHLYVLEAPTHLIFGISSREYPIRIKEYKLDRQELIIVHGEGLVIRQLETEIKDTFSFARYFGSEENGEITESLTLDQKQAIIEYLETKRTAPSEEEAVPQN